jgi:hypothetical protein
LTAIEAALTAAEVAHAALVSDVAVIYRDEYYDPMTQDQGIAEIIIAKQRNGPAGITKRLGYCKGKFSNVKDSSHDFINQGSR